MNDGKRYLTDDAEGLFNIVAARHLFAHSPRHFVVWLQAVRPAFVLTAVMQKIYACVDAEASAWRRGLPYSLEFNFSAVAEYVGKTIRNHDERKKEDHGEKEQESGTRFHHTVGRRRRAG